MDCPDCQGPLEEYRDWLHCRRCAKAFRRTQLQHLKVDWCRSCGRARQVKVEGDGTRICTTCGCALPDLKP